MLPFNQDYSKLGLYQKVVQVEHDRALELQNIKEMSSLSLRNLKETFQSFQMTLLYSLQSQSLQMFVKVMEDCLIKQQGRVQQTN